MTAPVYTVKWTETALKLLEAVPDVRVRRLVWNRAGDLAREPEKQGKPLTGELAGFWSVRAAGQRFRLVYTVKRQGVVVYIVAVGRRKEGDRKGIYELAKKLLRQGLVR